MVWPLSLLVNVSWSLMKPCSRYYGTYDASCFVWSLIYIYFILKNMQYVMSMNSLHWCMVAICSLVCTSVTHVDQSKMVEVRIVQFSPCSSPIPLVFSRPYLLWSRLLVQCCVCRLSSSYITWSIVAKRCVLEQKLLLTAYRKSYMRNRLVPKWMTLTFV